MSSTTANLTNVNFMSKERFDNLSTINDDELYAVKIDNIDNAESIINQNIGENPVKIWTGTRAEYEELVINDEIDDDTLYNITDDSDTSMNLLQTIYPVGSIYIGTMNICPLSALFGTWELVAQDRVLQGAGTRGSVGSTLNESLPNIRGEWSSTVPAGYEPYCRGAVTYTTSNADGNGSGYTGKYGYLFDASRSSSTYQDDAPVQQNAYLVNIWKRIA